MIWLLKRIFIFFGVLFIAAWLLLQSSIVQQKATEVLENLVFEATGYHIEASHLSLEFPSDLVVNDIALKDDKMAVLLSAKQAALSIDFSRIFQGDLPKLSLSIDQATLNFLPELPLSPGSTSDFQHPELKLSVNELEIAPSIFKNYDLPNQIAIHSLNLKDIIFYSSAETFELSGVAFLKTALDNMAFDIDADFKVLQDLTLNADFNALFSEHLPFSGTLHLTPQQILDGSRITIPRIEISSLKGVMDIPENLNGKLNAEIKISGPLSAPLLHIDLVSDSMTLNAIELKNTTGTIKSEISQELAKGSIHLESIINQKEIALTTDFNWPFNGKLTLPTLDVKAPGTTFQGSLGISFNDKVVEGKASGTLNDLSWVNYPFPFSLAGPITFELTVPPSTGQTAFAKLNFPQITIDELMIPDAVLEITLTNFIDDPIAEVHLSATNSTYQQIVVEKLSATTTWTTQQIDHPFSFSSEGLWDNSPVFVNATGSWQNLDDQWQVILSSLSGNAFAQPYILSEAMIIHKNQKLLSFSPFSFSIGSGMLKGSLSLSEQEVQGSVSLSDFSLNLLPAKMMDLPAKGTFAMDASLAGTPTSPQVYVKIDTHGLTLEEKTFSKLNPNLGELILSLENNLFSGKGQVTSPTNPPVHFDVQVPVIFSLVPFEFHIAPEAPLSGSITAEGEIAPILQLVLDNPTTFSGHATTVLNLAGTFSNPQLTGSCEISAGSYEIPEIGVLLVDLSAKIEAIGSQLNITHLEANDGKGGHVAGSGNFLIDKEQFNPFILQLNLTEATLLNQDFVQVVCNGPLTFKGNSKEGALFGELQVPKATVTIPERSYSTINTVEVTYINIPENTPKPQALNTQNSSWPLALDIHLIIPRSLSVKGKDLSSIWRGEIAVQGQAKTPLLFGELKITDGEYLFNGNPFAINQGTITFAGDLDKKTTLYVIASKDLDKIKVDVIAKGPIRNPELSFRSNPPLPQREILSWILFNRGTSEISPFQGSQLSESITNLSTNQQGPDVLSKIRSTLGIDRFEICRNPNNDNNEVNVQVGKYISDNVLISVIKSDVNRLAIEATLTDKIKLQAQVGDDSQGQILLKWKRDY